MDLLSWKGSYAYVDQWFWMTNPSVIVGLAVFYVWMSLYKVPQMMKDRPPYDIRSLMLGYNLFQVFSCSAIVIRTLSSTYKFSLKYVWVCDDSYRGTYDEIPETQKLYFWATMLILLLRSSEYFETLFYNLRKKQNQVTILHSFHHIAVTFLMWVYAKYGLEKNGGFVILLNSFVHIVMYIYFILGNFESTKQFAKGIKKQMTMFQIVQLLTLLAHSIRMIMGCDAPIYYLMLAPAVTALVALFINFYIRTYIMKPKQKAN